MAGLYLTRSGKIWAGMLLNFQADSSRGSCIARALTVDPEVLLLDEPCSALDVKSSAVIEEMLTELKKRYTIVIVTHNIAQARRISDYGAFLLGGRLVEWGESDQLFGCPAQEEQRAFLARNLRINGFGPESADRRIRAGGDMGISDTG